MNEQEWLECTDPQAMLDFMSERTSRRKIELYTTGSYRLVWDLLSDERLRKKIEVRERYVDGLATEAEDNAAIDAAEAVPLQIQHDAWDAIPSARQVQLVRDIFGNPFRYVRVDPSWLKDRTVQKLAQDIYDERAFARLPILGEALANAGCTNPDILTHCRQPAEHWRGCWLIDLLLAKE
ncbi:MAG TPA: hypothetical protein VKI65_00265 [Gemmataceae bacterium]|nr:hypothetical protein [Gemmataceae bacterium]